MRDPDAAPAALPVHFDDRRRRDIRVPCREVSGIGDSSRPRHANAQFTRCIEKMVAAVDHGITLGGAQGMLDERPQRRVKFMKRVQLRHGAVIARYDDVRPAFLQRAPKAGE